jgi:hypothetical protein
MDESQALLIAEQLSHFKSIFESRFDRLETELHHQSELDCIKHDTLEKSLTRLDATIADHESRIRANTDSASQFRLFAGGASLTSIFAIIRSFFP